jgi:hypothetical protein
MRARVRTGSVAALLLLGAVASCSRRNLDLGAGTGNFSFDAGPSDAAPPTDAGPAPADGPGGAMGLDAAPSSCVTASVQLPWTTASSSTPLRLDVAATADAVAAINRQAKQTDVRTYERDGTVISGFQFGADAQFLPYNDTRFLLVARGVTGDFVATAIAPNLRDSTRLFMASADATEHLLDAIVLSSTAIVAITDEHFVNLATGTIVSWSTILGAADKDAFKSTRILGIAARTDRVMVAWGTGSTLRLAVIGADGSLISRADDSSFFGFQGSDSAATFPLADGLLMFDGNPIRVTQFGFDQSRIAVGQNTQLRAFYRTTPKVAAISLLGRPVAFWLTVFPATDNSQATTTHQLYACELDPAALATCVRTEPIAATGLGGYTVATQPVAAAAFPGDGAFATAHTDSTGASWLRVAHLGCTLGGP